MSPETILRIKLFSLPSYRKLVARSRLRNKLADALCPETRLARICALAEFGSS